MCSTSGGNDNIDRCTVCSDYYALKANGQGCTGKQYYSNSQTNNNRFSKYNLFIMSNNDNFYTAISVNISQPSYLI